MRIFFFTNALYQANLLPTRHLHVQKYKFLKNNKVRIRFICSRSQALQNKFARTRRMDQNSNKLEINSLIGSDVESIDDDYQAGESLDTVPDLEPTSASNRKPIFKHQNTLTRDLKADFSIG